MNQLTSSSTSLAIPSGNATKTVDETTTSVTSLGSSKYDSTSDVIGSARTPWYGTFIVIISKVMGTGILSLPFAAVTLGWATTMIALPLFAVACAFTGYQLQTVKLAHPELTSFADAGHKLVGPRFGVFSRTLMICTWIGESIAMLITVSNGIGSIYNEGILSCNITRTAIAALILVIPSQTRDFHSVAKYLSFPSTLFIILVVITIAAALIENLKDGDATFGEATRISLAPATNILSFFGALSSVTFAFQGQSIFMELITETKNPKEFTKSSSFAFAIMCFFYMFAVIVAYGVDGDQVVGYLPDVLTAGAVKTFVNILVVLHVTVGYVLSMQAVHSYAHSKVFPKTFKSESTPARIHWLLITVSFIFFAFVIANLVPFFSDVNSLIGALLGAPIVFGFPSLYYLLAKKTKGTSWKETLMTKLGPIKSGISCFFLFILFPVFCTFGTIGAVMKLINDVEHSGRPFDC